MSEHDTQKPADRLTMPYEHCCDLCCGYTSDDNLYHFKNDCGDMEQVECGSADANSWICMDCARVISDAYREW